MPFKNRIAVSRLNLLTKHFPIVAILGARQIGKSTLARNSMPGFEIIDLENPAEEERIHRNISLFLSMNKKVVIDEAQRLPELFPALRSHIDRNPRNKVLLLGSASPRLIKTISESLTGRVGFLELTGLSLLEQPMEPLWLKGGFPKVHWGAPKPRPEEWYAAYLKTYTEQDIPQLGYRIAARKVRNLLSMTAHLHGGICNLSELGGSLGMDYHSVAHVLDLMEGTFLLRILQPYYVNIGKRLVKSPKIYLRDTGMLHWLLGIGFSRSALLRHPKAGASFEGFCIEQILTQAQLQMPGVEPFYYRTQTGVEVDLLLKTPNRIIPVEIKMTLEIPKTKQLEIAMNDIGVKRGYVIWLDKKKIDLGHGVTLLGLEEFVNDLPRLLCD